MIIATIIIIIIIVIILEVIIEVIIGIRRVLFYVKTLFIKKPYLFTIDPYILRSFLVISFLNL